MLRYFVASVRVHQRLTEAEYHVMMAHLRRRARKSADEYFGDRPFRVVKICEYLRPPIWDHIKKASVTLTTTEPGDKEYGEKDMAK